MEAERRKRGDGEDGLFFLGSKVPARTNRTGRRAPMEPHADPGLWPLRRLDVVDGQDLWPDRRLGEDGRDVGGQHGVDRAQWSSTWRVRRHYGNGLEKHLT
jgi:hypothetical protein